MKYGAFVEAPYDDLVTSSTRFWRASGISLSATMDGISISTGSLETVLIGGVTFGQPAGVEQGPKVEPGAIFDLYPNELSVNERPYKHGVEYVVRFSRSVRGLKPNAAVEFRGIPLGRVDRIMIDQLEVWDSPATAGDPVLIRIEPGMIGLPDTEKARPRWQTLLPTLSALRTARHAGDGEPADGESLRVARHVSGRTGRDDDGFADHPTIPTIGHGLEGSRTGS